MGKNDDENLFSVLLYKEFDGSVHAAVPVDELIIIFTGLADKYKRLEQPDTAMEFEDMAERMKFLSIYVHEEDELLS